MQQASWSHDGKHLAVITAVNGGAPKMGQPSLPVVRLSIWDADRAVLAEVSLKDDGRAFAYAKKGEVFVQRIDEARPRSLTSDVNEKPASPSPAAAPGTAGSTPAPAAGTIAAPDDPDKKEQFSVISFSRDGAVLLATTKKAWYAIRVGDGSRRSLMTLDPDKEETSPKIDPIGWSPDGEGLFATWSARDTWERGLVRINVANGEMTSLVKDARLFGGFRFSRDGRTVVFTLSDGDQPAELYAADSGFAQIRRLTGVNEWIAASRTLPRSELVSYRDSDGKLLHGVLRYPVNYVKGQKYPTMFEIYETFFDNGFNGRAAFLANHGYAVFHPSVNLIQTRPGEAWIKGVTSAANRLIEMDSARRPRQDAAALHHRRPGSERAVEPVARDVLRAPAARQGGGVGALRERRPSPAQQRGREHRLRAAHPGLVRQVSEEEGRR